MIISFNTKMRIYMNVNGLNLKALGLICTFKIHCNTSNL